mmetsp:Transcript_20437/g.16883  ORF Transcript_20437/g.16883 Transcript_20437/m.16883 type:complete len:280 (-) Transcript_20437:135-974(-)
MERFDETERTKIANRKKKLDEEKVARAKMVIVKQEMMKKEQDEEKKEEDAMLDNIHKEIKKEHKKIMQDRATEKDKFTKLLEENKKRLFDLTKQEENAKEEDKKIIQEMMEREEALQRKREAEFQIRMDKIQKKMEGMGGVFSDAKEAELRDERRIMALQMEKDRKDIEIERQRRQQKYNQSQMVNSYLKKMVVDREDKKIDQKRIDKELFENNKRNLELENLKEEEKQKKKHEELVKNYDVVKDQMAMRESTRPRHMNENEVGINRDLLGEMKKRNII